MCIATGMVWLEAEESCASNVCTGVLKTLWALSPPRFPQVSDIIRSYGIANLLDEYHHGSRQWLYKEVDEWLQRSQGGEGGSDASRLFLLLADAVCYAGA